MKDMKKYKKLMLEKRMMSVALIAVMLMSSMIIFRPSEIFAAKKYNPSGAWRGTNEVVGGLLSISMYTSPDGGDVVGNWELDNFYGHTEGVIKKTSNKNQYKLIYAFGMDENNAGPTYFVLKMKSNKKLKLTVRKYDYKTEWKESGFLGIFELSKRYQS